MRHRPEDPKKLVDFLKEEQYHLGVLLRMSIKSADDKSNSVELKDFFNQQAERIAGRLESVETELETLRKRKKKKK